MDSNTLQEADRLVQAGLAASRANDVNTALQLFAQASAIHPASGVPHFLAGSEYAALGQFEKAEAALANAVLLAPDFHLARYQLGLLQFSGGRAAVALVTWGALFALGDEHALGHFVRGFAALAQDDFTGAKSHFQEGLARNADNDALSEDVRKVLARIEDVQSEEAPAADADGSAANHVLLSNYGKPGTLH